MNAFLTELLSLVAGIATGLIFERRSTKEAKLQNDELRRQVSVLRTSVLSIGGKHSLGVTRSSTTDLASLVTERAIATQDAEGRVDRGALVAYFVERDYSATDIDAVVAAFCQAGIAEEEGVWVRMS
jgi:hypothetical protein